MTRIFNHLALLCMVLGAIAIVPAPVAAQPVTMQCQPTAEDEMGPFYRPGAPLRSVIGAGYLLSGTVRSADDCSPLMAALIEFWMTGPDGRYHDKYRAAVITGEAGRYRLETDFPGNYASRPPHIHIRVSAEGFQTLTTQHYLEQGTGQASFDLVLVPREDD